jgi:glycosyltransferase involved in cell wall biosynthesis
MTRADTSCPWVVAGASRCARTCIREAPRYAGHLVRRLGVALLLEALTQLERRGISVEADVIGDGPLLGELQASAARLGIDAHVRFHGFVEDHRTVEELLAQAAIAVAPYEASPSSFTRFADPGKLKAYLAAGLPIVLTAVPPLASELAESAGAEIVPFEAGALGDAIERGFGSAERWRERRRAALSYAKRFGWNVLLGDFFEALGFDV